jgi:hypothetical protein
VTSGSTSGSGREDLVAFSEKPDLTIYPMVCSTGRTSCDRPCLRAPACNRVAGVDLGNPSRLIPGGELPDNVLPASPDRAQPLSRQDWYRRRTVRAGGLPLSSRSAMDDWIVSDLQPVCAENTIASDRQGRAICPKQQRPSLRCTRRRGQETGGLDEVAVSFSL